MSVMGYEQEAPFAVQIEPVEGCNLRCSFCGIRGIREAGRPGSLSGPFKFMDLATADAIAEQVAELGWNPRVEFAMHGEPTTHPDLPGLAARVRAHLPRAYVMLTTNAIPTLDRPGGFRGAVDALFDAGVNTIAVDNYRPHPVAPEFMVYSRPGVTVGDYPQDGGDFSPHKRVMGKRLVLVEDISLADEGNHSHLSNHAGAAGPPDPTAGGRCALPFREMSIRWDGSAALCCNDWRGTFKVGSVLVEGIEGIWQHPAMYAARRALMTGTRDFAPCQGCTHRSYRVGLLPDKKGKLGAELGPPQPGDRALLQQAVAGKTLTPVVLRKWEK